MPIDEEAWLADLQSGDAARQIWALHRACPCSGSSRLYERYMPQLHAMKKDRRPDVRRVALHLEEDALQVSMITDERWNGFRRNRPGGWGRKGEPHRKRIRYGEAAGRADRDAAGRWEGGRRHPR